MMVLNANLRTLQELDPGPDNTVITPTSYTVDFNDQDGGVGTVNTVGVKWTGAAVPLTFQTSNDGLVWTTVGTQTTAAVSVLAIRAAVSSGVEAAWRRLPWPW